MIKTNEEYIASKQALEDVELALIALQKKVFNSNPERYQIMSQPYLSHINNIRHEINNYLGLTIAEDSAIPLWIKLKGPRIEGGNIPIDILTRVLNNLKHGVRRVAKYVEDGTMPAVGQPKRDLKELCNLKTKILPGSIRIGISFPVPTRQITLDNELEQNPAEEAVKRLLLGASWVSGIEKRNIEEIFPLQEERFLILNQIDKITPRDDSRIKSVEFKGRMLQDKSVILISNHVTKVRKAINKAIPPEHVILQGVSREIDLDLHHFILRERPDGEKDIMCMYDETLEEDAMNALNMRIRVVGSLSTSKTSHTPNHLETEKIEILGSSEE